VNESRTSFQDVHLRFADAFKEAQTLGGREYRELLEIVAAILARLISRDLDHEERPQ
jgi:hypothetical protein